MKITTACGISRHYFVRRGLNEKDGRIIFFLPKRSENGKNDCRFLDRVLKLKCDIKFNNFT